MSHASLKEQLQALSIGLSSTSASSDTCPVQQTVPKSQFKQSAKTPKTGKPRPAWLEQAQYGVELLKAYFPNCFKEPKDIQPLKVGIKQDLVKFLSTRDEIVLSDKNCMVNSLSYYVNSLAYHKAMQEGAARVDLDGNPVGVVTAEEAKYSAECRQSKLNKKSSQQK